MVNKRVMIAFLTLIVCAGLASAGAASVSASDQYPPAYDWKQVCPVGQTLKIVPVGESLIFACSDMELPCSKKAVVGYTSGDGGGILSLCGVGGLGSSARTPSVDWKNICPAKLNVSVQSPNLLSFQCVSGGWSNVCSAKALVAYTSGDGGGALVMCGIGNMGITK